jgi:hypothetical protein
MKWSALATLFATPLALAGAIQADVVARTEINGYKGDMDMSYGGGSGSGNTVIVEEVVLIWVCMGGGTKTTTMNSMASVSSANAAASTHTVSFQWRLSGQMLKQCRSLLEVLQASCILPRH